MFSVILSCYPFIVGVCAFDPGDSNLVYCGASNDARRKMLAMLPIFQRSATETDPSCE